MQAARIATWDVRHVGPDDSLDTAISLMEEHRIRHLPVVEQTRAIGMLSDRDILLAIGWRLEVDRTVAGEKTIVGPKHVYEIMSIPALFIDPHCQAHEAARVMVEGKVHAVLLVEEGTVKGVVTSTDILEYLANSTDRDMDRPIDERMHANVRAVSRNAPLYQATRIIRENNIRHLPVLDGDTIVGIVSDRDLRRACGADAMADELARASDCPFVGASRVDDIMSGPVATLTECATLRDAARLMTTRRIGSVPVVRGGQLVGIVTDTDCLRYAAGHGDLSRPGT